MNIEATTLLEYFSSFIAVQSALVAKKYRLTPKEQYILAHCAAFNADGGNLHDFEELSRHLIAIGAVDSVQECSVYKNRLSIKKWIDTGRGRFRLPALLSTAKGYDLHIFYRGGGDRDSDRQVSETTGRGSQHTPLRPRLLRNLEGGAAV